MLAVNYSSLRKNMKSYFDKVTQDFEILSVTRKNNENLVILSEEAYNNLCENAYILSSKANYDWLIESKKQFENGSVSKRELIQDDE